jgi:hypothetical protein
LRSSRLRIGSEWQWLIRLPGEDDSCLLLAENYWKLTCCQNFGGSRHFGSFFGWWKIVFMKGYGPWAKGPCL